MKAIKQNQPNQREPRVKATFSVEDYPYEGVPGASPILPTASQVPFAPSSQLPLIESIIAAPEAEHAEPEPFDQFEAQLDSLGERQLDGEIIALHVHQIADDSISDQMIGGSIPRGAAWPLVARVPFDRANWETDVFNAVPPGRYLILPKSGGKHAGPGWARRFGAIPGRSSSADHSALVVAQPSAPIDPTRVLKDQMNVLKEMVGIIKPLMEPMAGGAAAITPRKEKSVIEQARELEELRRMFATPVAPVQPAEADPEVAFLRSLFNDPETRPKLFSRVLSFLEPEEMANPVLPESGGIASFLEALTPFVPMLAPAILERLLPAAPSHRQLQPNAVPPVQSHREVPQPTHFDRAVKLIVTGIGRNSLHLAAAAELEAAASTPSEPYAQMAQSLIASTPAEAVDTLKQALNAVPAAAEVLTAPHAVEWFARVQSLVRESMGVTAEASGETDMATALELLVASLRDNTPPAEVAARLKSIAAQSVMTKALLNQAISLDNDTLIELAINSAGCDASLLEVEWRDQWLNDLKQALKVQQ